VSTSHGLPVGRENSTKKCMSQAAKMDVFFRPVKEEIIMEVFFQGFLEETKCLIQNIKNTAYSKL
jgi:hypothetical protein